MKNKLIISAAGGGKTTYLISQALEIKNQRVLITTYTQANEEEIRKKFVEINGFIPFNITIQTWFSFLLEHGVRPYQNYMFDEKVNGLILVNSASVPFVPEREVKKHYFSTSNLIYSDKLSKFVCRCNEKAKNSSFDRLAEIYEYIFIDEVQDLAGYDLEIIKLLFVSSINILLVGDPRQVTYLTHSEKKYVQYTNGLIKDFIIKECPKDSCLIDEETLKATYRCNQIICDVSSELYSEFEKSVSKNEKKTGHDGVFLIKKKDVEKYLKTFMPLQLRYDIRVVTSAMYAVKNYGESKGLTVDRVIIYPTKPILDYLKDGIAYEIIKNRTGEVKQKAGFVAKFYVALTRARFSTAIICDDDFEPIKGVSKFSF